MLRLSGCVCCGWWWQLMGMCESMWKPDLEPEELFETVSQCLLAGADRFPALLCTRSSLFCALLQSGAPGTVRGGGGGEKIEMQHSVSMESWMIAKRVEHSRLRYVRVYAHPNVGKGDGALFSPGTLSEKLVLYRQALTRVLYHVRRDCLSGWGATVYIICPDKVITRTLRGRMD